jgi:hypothetical protein
VADHELAQINVARLRAPSDDPLVAEFFDALDRVNALAEASPGFVWRFQTEDGNATSVHPFGDELVIVNISTWVDAASLNDFAYRTDHAGFLRRRREWFERMVEASMALWWVDAGHRPTVAESVARLDHLRANGPSVRAFSFREAYAADGVLSAR